MQRASQMLTAADRAAICRAVAQAESTTSCEIVPIVATSSGRYDRAEDVAGLWFGLVAMAANWTFGARYLPEPGTWGQVPAWMELLALIASVVVGFVLGAALTSQVGWLRRLFTPRAMLREEVQARARQSFFDARVYRTRAQTGLLIYVSLFERQAMILADAQVVERLGQPALDELCQMLTARLRRGNLATALCESIEAVGRKLAPVLPRQTDDVNELPDALVILDRPL